MKPAIISAAIALVFASSTLAEAAGQDPGIDVDTTDIHGQRISLHGIDAPEKCRALDLWAETIT
jgi:endonuclease YncB( thermonuclease family)